MTYNTREEYLHAAKNEMRKWFDAIKYPLPETLFISIGFARTNKDALGVCYPPYDLHNSHIFISPILNDDHQILSTLLHELVHSVLPPDVHHGKEFSEVAGAVGLTPPWRATGVSDSLLDRIKELSNKLGKFPSEQLVPIEKPKKERTKNIIEIKCPSCEYQVKAPKKFIEEKGGTICPEHKEEMVVLEEDAEAEETKDV